MVPVLFVNCCRAPYGRDAPADTDKLGMNAPVAARRVASLARMPPRAAIVFGLVWRASTIA
jgi:hypothetical protein